MRIYTVQTYMREMGLSAFYPDANLSKRNLQHRTYAYLLGGLTIERPNMSLALTSPISVYNKVGCTWSRSWTGIHGVIAWQLDHSLEIDFVLDTVRRALALNSRRISIVTREVFLRVPSTQNC